MRIALVIEHLDPRRGGAEVYVHGFAAWLLGGGHQVAIVTQDVRDPPEGAEVFIVRPGGLTRAARNLSFARRAAEVLRGIAPDSSLATGKALGMRLYQPHGGAVRASQRQNLALVRSDRLRALKALFGRLNPRHRAARRLEQMQFADPHTRFVAISDMVRRDMLGFYHVADHRVALVYNGVDLERFDPGRLRPMRDEARARFGIGPATVLFLFAAHNFKLKGLGELLRAAATLGAGSAAEFRLLVVGRGPVRRFRSLAARVGAAKLVTFAGPADDMAPVYAAADAFVHPTWYDPCSLVTLEALAAGLPTVTTAFNGAAELMTPDAGIVLDAPRPVSRLAEAMRRLLDTGARAGMSRAARLAAERHPQDRNFREMLDCLERARAPEGRP